MEQAERVALIGRNLRALREEGMYSRAEFAKRSGVSEPTVLRIEFGDHPHPRRTTLEKMAGVFGLTVEDLLREDLTSPKDLAPSDSSEWHRGATETYARGATPRLYVLRRVERGELSAEEALRELQAR
jgi:transcriptional regulator with XRE-family HTH domain